MGLFKRMAIIVFLSMISVASFSQNCESYERGNYAVIGTSDFWDYILKIEVKDSKSYTPVRNASIEFYDDYDNRKMFTMNTGSEGVGVIFVKGCFPSSAKIRVTSQDYRYWERKIDEDPLRENKRENILALKGVKYWDNQNEVPSMNVITDLIAEEKYKIVDVSGNNTSFNRPAIYEYEVSLEPVEGRHIYRNEGEDSGVEDSEGEELQSINYNGEKLYIYPVSFELRWEKADRKCKNLDKFGYDDWRLPTKDELDEMYKHKYDIENFSEGSYWTSTPSTNNRVWYQDIGDGIQDTESKRHISGVHTGPMKCRCVRDE